MFDFDGSTAQLDLHAFRHNPCTCRCGDCEQARSDIALLSAEQDDDESTGEVTYADMAPAGISCGFELEYFPDAPVLALNVYHGDRWTQMHWISPAELDLLCARWQHIKNA